MISRASLSIFLIAFLFVRIKQGNLESWESISSSTGLLVVKSSNPNACRLCLIQTVGVDRIALVEKDLYTYSYLIKGRITMLETFLRQCYTEELCVIETDVNSIPTSLPTLLPVEYGINLFAMQLDSAIDKSLLTTFTRKKAPPVHLYGRYEIFFYKEIKAVYNQKAQETKSHPPRQPLVVGPIIFSTFLFDKFLPIATSTTGTQAQQNTLPFRKIIGRCFYLSTASFQCEKCIALHTTSFGVRIYTFKNSAPGLKTLFAFTTEHSQDTIHNHCFITYCMGMRWISTAACEKLNRIFPNDERILHEVGTAAMELYNKAYSATDCIDPANGNSCGFISSKPDIDFRLMMSQLNTNYVFKQDFSVKKTLKVKPYQTAILEQFLEVSTMSCAFVSTPQTKRLSFFTCIVESLAGNNGMLLLSSVSMSKIIILYDANVVSAACLMSCQSIKTGVLAKVTLMDLSQCNDYRSHQKSDPNVYPELSMFKNMLPGINSCLFILNTQQGNKVKECDSCLQTRFHKVSNIMMVIHEAGSYLWRIINDENTWSVIDQVLRRCIRKGPCNSMMLLPAMVCSEHEKYSRERMADGVRIKQKDMIPFDHLTVGLWPPVRIASNARGNFDDRGVFMVAFEAANSRRCVSCIVNQQEVFFVYAPTNSRFGYLWMTQTDPRILGMCRSEQSCIRLFFHKEGKQLDIRKGLRPWTALELESLF